MEVVKAVVFKHNADVRPLLETFNQMVNECIAHGLKNNIGSPMKLDRLLYDHFKQKYGFATHYCISACRVACGIIRSWKRLVKRGRADRDKPPVFKASVMKLQKALMRLKEDKIVVTTQPHSWVEIPLVIGSYQQRFLEAWKKGELKIGEITLLNDRAVVVFKKEVEEKEPAAYASVDINLMSLDILEAKDELKYRKIDLKKLYGIRVHYFEKRRKIQALSANKPKTSKMLMEKYSKREKRRVNDILHKITTAITREFVENGVSPILERLKGLSYNATRNKHAKRRNRKVSSLPYGKIQRFIEYKMAWYGYKTHYVSAKNTSKTCPRCGRLSKTNGQVYECKHCGYRADRHFVACMNMLRMWGIGFTPKALNEPLVIEVRGKG
ncbi:MAG: transposase [Candidatus Nezhaarchaeales archaeon]